MSGIGKWFAVSNDGMMTNAEMFKELQRDKVCPVMYYEENGERIVPIFPNQILAQDFAKRNTPRDFSIGTMEAFQVNIDQLESNDYKVVEINWPKKRATSVTVIHIDDKDVETRNLGYRSQSK